PAPGRPPESAIPTDNAILAGAPSVHQNETLESPPKHECLDAKRPFKASTAISGSRPMTTAPLAVHEYRPGGRDQAMAFLKRTRSELRLLRMVRVGRDFLRVYDGNGDLFEIRGLGYPDAELSPLCQTSQDVYQSA